MSVVCAASLLHTVGFALVPDDPLTTTAAHCHRDRRADKKHPHAMVADSQVDGHHDRRCPRQQYDACIAPRRFRRRKFICYCPNCCKCCRYWNKHVGKCCDASSRLTLRRLQDQQAPSNDSLPKNAKSDSNAHIPALYPASRVQYAPLTVDSPPLLCLD